MPIINRRVQTLDEFTIQQVRDFPNATGELSGLLRDIGLAAKRVHIAVNRAGLTDILDETDQLNVQGETVKKLDAYANDQFLGALRHGTSCAGLVSEEIEDMILFDDDLSRKSKYICLIDPLDGSSNIDVNVSIGSIFSVYRRNSPPGKLPMLNDFMQQGIRQVAAGYVIYGPSTMLVYATRRGVNGFTLDQGIGEFILTHPSIQCPQEGRIYSVNHGNFYAYPNGVREYIMYCQRKCTNSGGPYTHRYTGSMMCDVHRNLLKGGIFMYPATATQPKGKLRLQYECNPIAFILEVAGGAATDGRKRTLELSPVNIHARTSFFAGSKCMIEELSAYYTQG